MRNATLQRNTNETQISLELELDGTGLANIKTGCGFLNHMLTLFASHGRFNLTLQCNGDVDVDFHHTTEDIAIVLGRAFAQALGNCGGITRYGSFMLPMDEALVLSAIDISGRPLLCYALTLPTEKIGEFDSELIEEFFTAFARSLGATIHLRQLAGSNSHHIAEAAFKGFARALAMAVAIDETAGGKIPSTKGTIL